MAAQLPPTAAKAQIHQMISHGESEEGSRAEGGYLPEYAGALTIAAGIAAFVQSYVLIAYADAFGSSSTVCGLGVASGILGFCCLMGGWISMKRGSFTLAIIGSICAIVSVGFGVGVVLGIISIVLLALSKNQFAS